MIKQIIRSEEELRTLIRKDIKKAGHQCAPTKKELDEQVESFMSDEELAPKEYPIYAYIEFNFIYHGFDVDMLSTSHFVTKEEMEKVISEF